MITVETLPWAKINEFFLAVGKLRDPRDFCVEIVKEIYTLIPYDQARLYFVNDNNKIYDQALFGVEKYWNDAYLEYYSQIDLGRYNVTNNHDSRRHVSASFGGNIYDWTSQKHSEFITDYIKPQGLYYSLGFGLSGTNNLIKCSLCLDRINNSKYTDYEIAIISVIQTHLDNLHQNLYVNPLANTTLDVINGETPLTCREKEISKLLCDGVTPINIGKNLHLSVSTVYRHIANIHLKLHVSNRQELLLKLLNQPDNL